MVKNKRHRKFTTVEINPTFLNPSAKFASNSISSADALQLPSNQQPLSLINKKSQSKRKKKRKNKSTKIAAKEALQHNGAYQEELSLRKQAEEFTHVAARHVLEHCDELASAEQEHANENATTNIYASDEYWSESPTSSPIKPANNVQIACRQVAFSEHIATKKNHDNNAETMTLNSLDLLDLSPQPKSRGGKVDRDSKVTLDNNNNNNSKSSQTETISLSDLGLPDVSELLHDNHVQNSLSLSSNGIETITLHDFNLPTIATSAAEKLCKIEKITLDNEFGISKKSNPDNGLINTPELLSCDKVEQVHLKFEELPKLNMQSQSIGSTEKISIILDEPERAHLQQVSVDNIKQEPKVTEKLILDTEKIFLDEVSVPERFQANVSDSNWHAVRETPDNLKGSKALTMQFNSEFKLKKVPAKYVISIVNGLPFYARSLFKLSQTFNKFVKLTVAEIHKLYKLSGSDVLSSYPEHYWLNHPIIFVSIIGICVRVEMKDTFVYIRVDDGSGKSIECKSYDNDIMKQLEGIDPGSLVRVNGKLTYYRNSRQLVVKTLTVEDAFEEIRFWESLELQRNKILDKPWTCTLDDLNAMI
ncbi:telomere regulation protein Stn1-domain-containing protein [Lipomyces japonicus]|uniref:telomere regulation protein Stn1-domain-containing protein n=1 Tax=Lipomyces japonicus TaxID=56871 RepID=UPI0034CF51B8